MAASEGGHDNKAGPAPKNYLAMNSAKASPHTP